MKITAEEIERVLAAHSGFYVGDENNRCYCGKLLQENVARFLAHRAHVAAHILKLLESKEGEEE